MTGCKDKKHSLIGPGKFQRTNLARTGFWKWNRSYDWLITVKECGSVVSSRFFGGSIAWHPKKRLRRRLGFGRTDMNDILQKSDVKSRRQYRISRSDTARQRVWEREKMSQSQAISLFVCFTCSSKGHASWLWLVVFDPNFFYSWETFTHDANLHRCKFSQFAHTFRSIR